MLRRSIWSFCLLAIAAVASALLLVESSPRTQTERVRRRLDESLSSTIPSKPEHAYIQTLSPQLEESLTLMRGAIAQEMHRLMRQKSQDEFVAVDLSDFVALWDES